MSGRAWIRTRPLQNGGKTYQVLYRRGGRGFKQEHAGMFKLKRDAEKRRDLIAGWLVAGLNPRFELGKAQAQQPAQRERVDTSFTQFRDQRHKVTAKTDAVAKNAQAIVEEFFGAGHDPHALTVADFRSLVTWMVGEKKYSANTIRAYFTPIQKWMDYLKLDDPNPARHRTVELPTPKSARYEVLQRKAFHEMLDRLTPRYKLFFRVLEATGMRIGELYSLQWGDVDFAEARFRIFDTKGGTGGRRWCPVPPALMAEIADMLPLEDRETEGRVFVLVSSPEAARVAMTRACKLAGIAHYIPHDLRKRRASLWHAQFVPERVVQEWGGWESPDTLRKVYTHVVTDPRDDDWLGEARRRLDDMAKLTPAALSGDVVPR